MKPFDFIFCFMAADLISAGLVHGELFLLIIGIISYSAYEYIRKA